MKVYRIEHRDNPDRGPWHTVSGTRGVSCYALNQSPERHESPSDGPGLHDWRHRGTRISRLHSEGRVCAVEHPEGVNSWFPCRQGRKAMQRRGWHLVVYSVVAQDVFSGISQCTFTIAKARRIARLSLVTFKPIGAVAT